MSSATIYGSASAFCRNLDTGYTVTHDAVSADDVFTSSINIYISNAAAGQPGDYQIERGYYIFDTSALDDNSLIQSVTLRLYVAAIPNVGDGSFNINVRNGMPTYPHNPVVVGDYRFTHYSGNGGSTEVTGTESDTDIFDISLNSVGKSWINLTGETKFALLSSDDVASTIPDGLNRIRFYEAGNATYKARLIITYYVATGIPVVGDPTYSNTKATYTKATANVSDEGGGYEERGFEYGTSETPTWAVRETGIWGATGNFSLTLPDLLPLTTYYARAYVANDYGTGFSDWTSFTTTDVPTYGIYEESKYPLSLKT